MDKYLPLEVNKSYFACTDGKVFNKLGKEIGCTNKAGYMVVWIKNVGTNKFVCYYVHRLIWETFKGKIPEGMEIDHINTNRSDNRLKNLRLVSHQDNCNNPKTVEKYRKSNSDKSIKNNEKTSKKIYQYTLDGKLIQIWPSRAEAGRNGYCLSVITQCCFGKCKTHKGYIWSNNPI